MTDVVNLGMKVDSTDVKNASKNLDNLEKSGKGAGKVAEELQRQFEKLAAILGPALLIRSLTRAVEHSIHLRDEYQRLAEVAGTTASVIASFDRPARLAGVEMNLLGTIIGRLAKVIGDARLGDPTSGGLLSALGIQLEKGQDAAQILVEIAKATTTMKDQTVAASAANTLLGVSFSTIRPFLNEIVKEGGLNAKVTEEQIAAAKELADQQTILEYNFERTSDSLATALIPTLLKIVGAFNDMSDEMADVSTHGEVLGNFLKILTSLGLAAKDIFYGLGTQIGAVGAATIALFQGQFQAAYQIIQDNDREVQAHTEVTNRAINKLWDDTAKNVQKAREAVEGAAPGRSAAEERLRAFFEERRLYESRVAAQKAFGTKYAEAIKTANILAQEAFVQGGIDNQRTQEELIRQQAANNQANLQAQIAFLHEQERLHRTQGNIAKAAETASAIAQINAQIVADEIITQAKIQSLRTVTARQQEEENAAWLKMLYDRGESLALSFGTETEIENRAYRERLDALDVYLSEATDQISNEQQIRERLELEHQARLGDLFAQGALERMKFDAMTWDMQAKTVAGAVAGITSSVTGQSKRMFELNKLAAIADIIVSTSQGIMKAWGQGGFFGIGMAALIAAAGALNLQRVKSTHFEGGGTTAPSIGSLAAGGATPTVPVPNAGAPAPASGSGVTVIVQGNFIGTQQFMDEVVLPAIRDAADNRDWLPFHPQNSQIAQRLVRTT